MRKRSMCHLVVFITLQFFLAIPTWAKPEDVTENEIPLEAALGLEKSKSALFGIRRAIQLHAPHVVQPVQGWIPNQGQRPQIRPEIFLPVQNPHLQPNYVPQQQPRPQVITNHHIQPHQSQIPNNSHDHHPNQNHQPQQHHNHHYQQQHPTPQPQVIHRPPVQPQVIHTVPPKPRPIYNPQPTQQPHSIQQPQYHPKHPQHSPQRPTRPRPHRPREEDQPDGESDDSTDNGNGSSDRRPGGQRDYFPPPNIVGLLEDEEATTLLSLLEAAGLLSALEGRGTFTILAPTNKAFSKLDQDVIRQLTNDADLLADVLKYHVIPGGKLFSRVIKDDLMTKTLLNDTALRFNRNENGVTVNGAEINLDKVDQKAANGIVHFLNDVIYPIPVGSLFEAMSEDNRFITLVRALEVADLIESLNTTSGPFTIFAPTDEAFDLIPREALNELLDDPSALKNVLLKHVVRGTKLSPALTFVDLIAESGDPIQVRTKRGRVSVNEATLVDGDIIALNGAIQVIDRVLL
ncbi:periostin-like [Tigriopus californicus]|uniref:periostin-like n=1 Tax=Tigriopus californicus TaxID=6832 RepID=UPI0027DA7B51|nr:periostin-like [Tigriopus californicus]